MMNHTAIAEKKTSTTPKTATIQYAVGRITFPFDIVLPRGRRFPIPLSPTQR